MLKINHILITSNSPTFELLENWCAIHTISLTRKPQIETLPLPNLTIPKTDWVFFSSPQGAQLYLNHYPIEAAKIAVYGKGTAEVILKQSYQVSFCGRSIAQASEIGASFAQTIGQAETVLFPLSNRSMRNISKEIPARQCHEIITYTTHFTPQSYPISPAIILFTSPSNYEGYTQLNTIDKDTYVIAIGKTTERAIKGKHEKLYLLEEPNARALVALLEVIIVRS